MMKMEQQPFCQVDYKLFTETALHFYYVELVEME